MGTRVNLNASHANQIYGVSRKDCGKLELGVIVGLERVRNMRCKG